MIHITIVHGAWGFQKPETFHPRAPGVFHFFWTWAQCFLDPRPRDLISLDCWDRKPDWVFKITRYLGWKATSAGPPELNWEAVLVSQSCVTIRSVSQPWLHVKHPKNLCLQGSAVTSELYADSTYYMWLDTCWDNFEVRSPTMCVRTPQVQCPCPSFVFCIVWVLCSWLFLRELSRSGSLSFTKLGAQFCDLLNIDNKLQRFWV